MDYIHIRRFVKSRLIVFSFSIGDLGKIGKSLLVIFPNEQSRLLAFIRSFVNWIKNAHLGKN